ncbi:MAG: hypothetical protein AB4352_01865 [Hormoscilla sp.]
MKKTQGIDHSQLANSISSTGAAGQTPIARHPMRSGCGTFEYTRQENYQKNFVIHLTGGSPMG